MQQDLRILLPYSDHFVPLTGRSSVSWPVSFECSRNEEDKFRWGEPFLHKKFLGIMISFCKEQLHLESVSIVTNGSLVDDKFLRSYGRYVDILAVSCDSFDEQTNIAIGRGSGNQVDKLFEIAGLCRKYNIKLKLNTVVCRLNYEEDMNATVEQLQPFRWKCFKFSWLPARTIPIRPSGTSANFKSRTKTTSCSVVDIDTRNHSSRSQML